MYVLGIIFKCISIVLFCLILICLARDFKKYIWHKFGRLDEQPKLSEATKNVEDYKSEKLLLDGKVKLVTELSEMRMAIWLNSFGLYDAVTGETILPMAFSFDLTSCEEENNLLKITFRSYPYGYTYFTVTVNPERKIFQYKDKEYELAVFSDIMKTYDLVSDMEHDLETNAFYWTHYEISLGIGIYNDYCAFDARSVDILLAFIEKYPLLDFGHLGELLVSFMEKFSGSGYEDALLKSIARRPTLQTVSMLGNLIRKTPPSPQYDTYLMAMQVVADSDDVEIDIRKLAQEYCVL